MPSNTTVAQDRAISTAFQELEEVINELDMQITEWKDVSGCKSPDELAEKLAELESKQPFQD